MGATAVKSGSGAGVDLLTAAGSHDEIPTCLIN